MGQTLSWLVIPKLCERGTIGTRTGTHIGYNVFGFSIFFFVIVGASPFPFSLSFDLSFEWYWMKQTLSRLVISKLCQHGLSQLVVLKLCQHGRHYDIYLCWHSNGIIRSQNYRPPIGTNRHLKLPIKLTCNITIMFIIALWITPLLETIGTLNL